jgi:hypothetical protein
MKVSGRLSMLTLSLTCQQLYELYHEGVQPTIHLIESLIEQLADFERLLGARHYSSLSPEGVAGTANTDSVANRRDYVRL